MVGQILNREDGKSVRDKINTLIDGFNAGPHPFASRADLLAFAGEVTPATGAVAHAGGVSYRYTGSGTAIADLPGWVPNGDVYPDHFKELVSSDTTDMAPAIQAAIDYLGTTGGEVKLRGRGYRINSPVYIRNPNVRIVGQGQFSSVIKIYSDINAIVFQRTSPMTGGVMEGNALIDVGIQYFTVTNPVASVGVLCDRTSRFTMRGCRVINAWKGVSLRGTGETCIIADSTIDSGSATTAMQAGSRAIEIVRRQVDASDPNAVLDAADGLYYTEPNSVYLSNLNLRSLGSFGIEDVLFCDAVDGLYLTNCHIGFGVRSCVHFRPAQPNMQLVSVQMNNVFVDPLDGVTDAGILYDRPDTRTGYIVRKHTWTNVQMSQPRKNSVRIDIPSLDWARFIGFDFHESDEAGVLILNATDVTFSHGTVTHSAAGGGAFAHFEIGKTGTTVSRCKLFDVSMEGTGQHGVLTQGTVTEMFCDDLDIKGTTGGPLNLTATGARYLGRITSDKSLSGQLTRAKGSASVTPGADGTGLIAHGLHTTPATVFLTFDGDSTYEATLQGKGAANIQVRIRNTQTNADVTTGTYTVLWEAET